RSGWEVIPEVVNGVTRMEAVPWVNGQNLGLKNHVKDHLDCIRKRNFNTKANPEIASHIAKFSAVGNIAYRTGKKLIWDGTRFVNDEEANNYLVPQYREPWVLPKV
ncbi:MAG: gfo/Idh/MocA family oxidoreductase, partial [Bacteroidales bacterium]|nr:gfo/Idh/MocA family oxidoreductase [Bacteroidales bacterium]